MRRDDSLETTLMLGETEGRRKMGATDDEMDGWHHRFNGHMSLSKLLEIMEDRGAWHATVQSIGHNIETEQQQVTQM